MAEGWAGSDLGRVVKKLEKIEEFPLCGFKRCKIVANGARFLIIGSGCPVQGANALKRHPFSAHLRQKQPKKHPKWKFPVSEVASGETRGDIIHHTSDEDPVSPLWLLMLPCGLGYWCSGVLDRRRWLRRTGSGVGRWVRTMGGGGHG